MHLNGLVRQKENGNEEQQKAEKQRTKMDRKEELRVRLMRFQGNK